MQLADDRRRDRWRDLGDLVERGVVRQRADVDLLRGARREVGGDDRVTEIARMLSGRPGSESGRDHAKELLEEAEQTRALIRTGSGAFD